MIAVNTPYANRPGTVGELLPGIEYRLQPVEGIDEGGILSVRGDNLMLGYLEGPKGVEDGWYSTGDIATVEDSVVKLTGRVKRFAKIAGEMVSLEVVERIAAAAKPNAVHASVSIRDTARGEAIILFTEDSTMKREDLQVAARSIGAAEIAIPRRVQYVAKIPLLGNGKKDYVTLARMAAGA